MIGGGLFHTWAFPKAAVIIDASSLSARYAAMYKALWLNDSVAVTLVGVTFLVLARWPGLGTRAMVAFLAVLPLGSALSIYMTIGNFPPGHLLLVAGGMALIAALVPAAAPIPPSS